MGQLGVLDNPNYKITALLDHLAMITVQSDSHGTFDCKPLGLIWAQYPEVRTTLDIQFFILLLKYGLLSVFFLPKYFRSSITRGIPLCLMISKGIL